MSAKVNSVHLTLQVKYKSQSLSPPPSLSSEQSVRFNPQVYLSTLLEFAIAKHPLQSRQSGDTLLEVLFIPIHCF